MVFIDDNILWYGSLNVLSYGGKSTQAETIMKIVSKAMSSRAAKNLIYKHQNFESEKNKSPLLGLDQKGSTNVTVKKNDGKLKILMPSIKIDNSSKSKVLVPEVAITYLLFSLPFYVPV